jgi:hypothetical protein
MHKRKSPGTANATANAQVLILIETPNQRSQAEPRERETPDSLLPTIATLNLAG